MHQVDFLWLGYLRLGFCKSQGNIEKVCSFPTVTPVDQYICSKHCIENINPVIFLSTRPQRHDLYNSYWQLQDQQEVVDLSPEP
jgi:hypothetical protein